MSKIKNLYLPGTNKNVGYLDKDVMHIYKRYMQYLPWSAIGTSHVLVDTSYPFILTIKEKKAEKIVKVNYTGWISNIDLKTYDFYNCTFSTPDNLDVIEMAYLYKHWKAKKNVILF
jgi:hypothetical protein